MISRNTLGSHKGYSLVEVKVTDENGNFIEVTYEVCDPDGNVMGTFSSLNEAQRFLKSLNLDNDQEPPSDSPGM